MADRGTQACGECGRLFPANVYTVRDTRRGCQTYCGERCRQAAKQRQRAAACVSWQGIEIGHCGRWHRVRGLPVVCAVCGVVILDNNMRGEVEDEAGAGAPM